MVEINKEKELDKYFVSLLQTKIIEWKVTEKVAEEVQYRWCGEREKLKNN